MRATMTARVPGSSSRGRARLVPWRGHIIHLAVAAGGEPVQQADSSAPGSVGAGDADGREAEFPAPVLDARRQRARVFGIHATL